MKRILWAAVFAIVGVLTCVGVQAVLAGLSLTPRFPAFAGEDDFNLRFQYFLFVACPAFAAMGAWIGAAFSRDRREAGYMWLGVLAGSVLTFSMARLLSSAIVGLSTRDAANRGVLVLFLIWVLFSALGAFRAKLIIAGR